MLPLRQRPRPGLDRARLAAVALPLLPLCGADCAAGSLPGPDDPLPDTRRRLSIDLEDAVRMALEKNFQIQADTFLPEIAAQRLRSEWGRFDPAFEASASRDEATDRRPLDDGTPASSIAQVDRFDVGITGLLPWGLRYDAGLETDNRRASSDAFADNFTSSIGIGLTQPLLRGGGFGANMAGVRIARANRASSDWELRGTAIDVVTRVVITYNELHFFRENLEVARRSRDLARRLLRDNTLRAEIGVMSPLDITQARAEAAQREEGVIDAERNARNTENLLKSLITDDIATLLATRLEIAPPPAAAGFEPDVEAGIRDALALRPDYQQALLDITRRNIRVVVARNQALPRLDLVGSLRLLGFDNSLDASFAGASRRDSSEWSAAAVVSIPLGNRDRLGELHAAKLEAARALVDLKRLEQQIVVEVDNAAISIIAARQRIASTSESTRLARENLDAGQERLATGVGTTFVVLQFQRDLAEAEAAELRARADFTRAVAEFQRRTGTTLRERAVAFAP